MDKELYPKLIEAVEALPKEAIETAKKEVTRKGYDTTGYQYQFLVNVLNEIVGMGGWGMSYEVLKEIAGQWSNGKTFWEITANVTVSIGDTSFTLPGGHKAELHADALKGAVTNGFKKTLGMFGVGKKAYEGTLDDDYKPLPPEETGQLKTEEKSIPKPIRISDRDRGKIALERIAALLDEYCLKYKAQSLKDDIKRTVAKHVFGTTSPTEISKMPWAKLEKSENRFRFIFADAENTPDKIMDGKIKEDLQNLTDIPDEIA